MTCGFPYCGGNSPECRTCGAPSTPSGSTKLQDLVCRFGDCRASGDTYNATVYRFAALKAINEVHDALKDLLDGIHAGRFVPDGPASEGYCHSLVEAGEAALEGEKPSSPRRAQIRKA